jgi:hypothetical protein
MNFTRGRFPDNRELSAILDAQLFPTLLSQMKKELHFYRALWTEKVNFLVKKMDAVALNNL